MCRNRLTLLAFVATMLSGVMIYGALALLFYVLSTGV